MDVLKDVLQAGSGSKQAREYIAASGRHKTAALVFYVIMQLPFASNTLLFHSVKPKYPS